MTTSGDERLSSFARSVLRGAETSTYRIDLGSHRGAARLSNRLEAVSSEEFQSATLFEPQDRSFCIEMEQSFRIVEHRVRAESHWQTKFDGDGAMSPNVAHRQSEPRGVARLCSFSASVLSLFGVVTLLRDMRFRANLRCDTTLWLGPSIHVPAAVAVGRRTVVECDGLNVEAWPVTVRPILTDLNGLVGSSVARSLPALSCAFDACGSNRLLTMELPSGMSPRMSRGRVEFEAESF